VNFVIIVGGCLLAFSAGTGFGAVIAFNIAAEHHKKKDRINGQR